MPANPPRRTTAGSRTARHRPDAGFRRAIRGDGRRCAGPGAPDDGAAPARGIPGRGRCSRRDSSCSRPGGAGGASGGPSAGTGGPGGPGASAAARARPRRAAARPARPVPRSYRAPSMDFVRAHVDLARAELDEIKGEVARAAGPRPASRSCRHPRLVPRRHRRDPVHRRVDLRLHRLGHPAWHRAADRGRGHGGPRRASACRASVAGRRRSRCLLGIVVALVLGFDLPNRLFTLDRRDAQPVGRSGVHAAGGRAWC